MKTLTVRLPGGFVCGLRSVLISSGIGYTQCGNKRKDIKSDQLGWGMPKCKACQKVLQISPPPEAADPS